MNRLSRHCGSSRLTFYLVLRLTRERRNKPPEILEKYSIMAKAKSPSKSKAPATNLNATGTNGAASALRNSTSTPTPASSLQTSSAKVSSIRNAETPRPSPATAIETNPSVSEEQVRRRAYELYVQRGGSDGGHDADWFRAEAELRSRSKAS